MRIKRARSELVTKVGSSHFIAPFRLRSSTGFRLRQGYGGLIADHVGSKFPGFCEGFEAAVVGGFGGGREAAAGELLAGEVVLDALTAGALSRAVVGAGAVLEILGFIYAVHRNILSLTGNLLAGSPVYRIPRG